MRSPTVHLLRRGMPTTHCGRLGAYAGGSARTSSSRSDVTCRTCLRLSAPSTEPGAPAAPAGAGGLASAPPSASPLSDLQCGAASAGGPAESPSPASPSSVPQDCAPASAGDPRLAGRRPWSELLCPLCGLPVKWSCSSGPDGTGRAECQDGRRVSRRWPGTAEPCEWQGARIRRTGPDGVEWAHPEEIEQLAALAAKARTAAGSWEAENKRARERGLTVREACRQRYPLDGADAQALEHAIAITERERDEARGRLAAAEAATTAAGQRALTAERERDEALRDRDAFAVEARDLRAHIDRLEIGRWFSEGMVAARADGEPPPRPYDGVADHWWSRGYSYTARLLRALEAESALIALRSSLADALGVPADEDLVAAVGRLRAPVLSVRPHVPPPPVRVGPRARRHRLGAQRRHRPRRHRGGRDVVPAVHARHRHARVPRRGAALGAARRRVDMGRRDRAVHPAPRRGPGARGAVPGGADRARRPGARRGGWPRRGVRRVGGDAVSAPRRLPALLPDTAAELHALVAAHPGIAWTEAVERTGWRGHRPPAGLRVGRRAGCGHRRFLWVAR